MARQGLPQDGSDGTALVQGHGPVPAPRTQLTDMKGDSILA
jgi:hypothetical protein